MLLNRHIHFNGFCFAAENKQSQIMVYKDLYRTLLMFFFYFVNERALLNNYQLAKIYHLGSTRPNKGRVKNLYFYFIFLLGIMFFDCTAKQLPTAGHCQGSTWIQSLQKMQ